MMYCPKCGRKCGADDRFCLACGAALPPVSPEAAPKEPPRAAWKPGMPCPHCGGTELSGNRCAFCGAQLIFEKEPAGEDESLYEIPCGTYNGIADSITLYEKECLVRNSFLRQIYETKISYNQITSVLYIRREMKFISKGYLTICWEGDETLAMPETKMYGSNKTTVATSEKTDLLFYHIYYLLKALAPASAEFRMEIPPVDTKSFRGSLAEADLDFCFNRFSPYRERAVKELRKRISAKEKTAKAIIDTAFDERQKALYEANPKAAIRDLNLVIQEIQRRKEEERLREMMESRHEK